MNPRSATKATKKAPKNAPIRRVCTPPKGYRPPPTLTSFNLSPEVKDTAPKDKLLFAYCPEDSITNLESPVNEDHRTVMIKRLLHKLETSANMDECLIKFCVSEHDWEKLTAAQAKADLGCVLKVRIYVART